MGEYFKLVDKMNQLFCYDEHLIGIFLEDIKIIAYQVDYRVMTEIKVMG